MKVVIPDHIDIPASALQRTIKPVLAAILLALCQATMGVWIRMMADSFGSWQQVYLRILLAGILAWVVYHNIVSWDFIRQLTLKGWAFYVVRSIMYLVVGVGFVTIAVQNTTLSTVSFIAVLPIMGILGWILFREKVQIGTIPFIFISVLGLAMLTGINLTNIRLGWGEQAAIISMLGFNLSYLLSRLHRKSFSNQQNTTIMLLVGWVPLLIISLLSHEAIVPSHVSVTAWVGLIVSAVMNVAILLLINYVFGHLKAYVAGNIMLLNGVFALLFGLVLFGEVPTLAAILGAGVILVCAFVISMIDAGRVRLAAKETPL